MLITISYFGKTFDKLLGHPLIKHTQGLMVKFLKIMKEN